MVNNRFYNEQKIELIPNLIIIPKFFVDYFSKNIYETLELRRRLIERKCSPAEEKFYADYPQFYREMILFIEYREIWWEILEQFLISKDSKLYDKNFFMLDFFEPRSSFNIEIDSRTHHSNTILEDRCRDEYLRRVFGIRTLRFMQYDFETPENRARIEKELSYSCPFCTVNFPTIFEKLYQTMYKKELEIYNKITNSYSYRYYRQCQALGVIFTKKDLKHLGIEPSDMNSALSFLKYYYNLEVSIISKAKKYTFRKAYEEAKDQNWINWIYAKSIPDWVIELKGIPPNYITAAYNSSFGKHGTKHLLEELRRLGYI